MLPIIDICFRKIISQLFKLTILFYFHNLISKILRGTISWERHEMKDDGNLGHNNRGKFPQCAAVLLNFDELINN